MIINYINYVSDRQPADSRSQISPVVGSAEPLFSGKTIYTVAANRGVKVSYVIFNNKERFNLKQFSFINSKYV